jgi:hypothetical protein
MTSESSDPSVLRAGVRKVGQGTQFPNEGDIEIGIGRPRENGAERARLPRLRFRRSVSGSSRVYTGRREGC